MYARTDSRPVQHMDFLKSHSVRQRYWARNFVAWPRFSAFQPNATHHAIARMEREGRCSAIVTQNVDRLHTKAGCKNVLELHGSGYSVGCVGKSNQRTTCDYSIDRHEFQNYLNTLNATVLDEIDTIRPDGDVDISQVSLKFFSFFNL